MPGSLVKQKNASGSDERHFREPPMRRISALLGVVLVAALASSFTPAQDDPPPKEKPKAGEVVLTDTDGKETRLSDVKLTTGTRRLVWLADPKGTTPDEKLGPLALEVREPNSTTLARGVLTLIPVASVESVKYDYEKLTSYVSVKGVKEPILGTLQYRGINTLGVSGTADGKVASFTAGALGKAGVKSITFSHAKPVEAKAGGRNWAVQIFHPAANNPTVKAKNLKVLFQNRDGTQQLVDALPVRKGPAVTFDAKLSRFEMLDNTDVRDVKYAVADIELGKGEEKTIVIPLAVDQDGKQTGTLAGLLGEVETGYKLFPLHTIKIIVPLSKKTD
jgi:hypothetical protein